MAETKPGRLDQSRSCRFLKVATHPFRALGGLRVKKWGHLEQAKRKSQLEWHSLCWPN